MWPQQLSVFNRPTAALALSRRRFLRGTSASFGLLYLARLGIAAGGETPSGASRLRVHTTTPLNAETPLDRLRAHWITPVEDFYIRSHAPNPEIDLQQFRVRVEGLVERPLSYGLKELREQFSQAETTATLCCAGNRREQFAAEKPAEGVQWGAGAIGNAKWTGVRLRDVLKRAGVQESARHVWFEGLDRHEKAGREIVFGGSIPLERVFRGDPEMDVLLAHTMNGEPLTADHGAPLRGLVPGYIGARSVKWLSKIVVSDRPSANHYVAEAYKLVGETTPAAWEGAEILYELPLQSAICQVEANTDSRRTRVTARGYALPSGREGQTIERVELSLDDGRTWTTADLEEESRPGCWQFWSAELRSGRRGGARLLVRAIGSDWKMQPRRPAWNVKGYLFDGWHVVELDGV